LKIAEKELVNMGSRGQIKDRRRFKVVSFQEDIRDLAQRFAELKRLRDEVREAERRLQIAAGRRRSDLSRDDR
jgi:hypothetical protein